MLREAIHIMEMAYKTGRLEALDIVEINPRLGNSINVKTTLEAAVHVIKAAFGHRRSGNIPPHIERIPGFYKPPKNSQFPIQVLNSLQPNRFLAFRNLMRTVYGTCFRIQDVLRRQRHFLKELPFCRRAQINKNVLQ